MPYVGLLHFIYGYENIYNKNDKSLSTLIIEDPVLV